jgi:2-polyprenyl-3-methyl-5-hydroxy-6-metoxy-1,4-benzoquinol methylase
MKRFDWRETKKYWGIYSAHMSKADYENDPDGLLNVCLAWEPLWYNKFIARFQRKIYQKLMKLVPAPQPGHRALDIGCGAGRWCRLLLECGYDVTGIDLQPDLIEADRKRYPNIKFFNIAAQDFNPEAPFDLISTVTVIQHNPFEEQDVVIRKMRQMLKPGGHVIALENTFEQAANTHSNSIEVWKSKFEKAGFATVAVQRYDYIPFLRVYLWLGSKLYRAFINNKTFNQMAMTPETLVTVQTDISPTYHQEASKGMRKIIHELFNTGKAVAIVFDTVAETALIAANWNFTTYHCGFVFKAV